MAMGSLNTQLHKCVIFVTYEMPQMKTKHLYTLFVFIGNQTIIVVLKLPSSLFMLLLKRRNIHKEEEDPIVEL